MKPDKKAFWQGQLTGLRTLPTESGAWGVLLPTPMEKRKIHEPDATEFVETLDARRLVFNARDFEDGNRGFEFAVGSFFGMTLFMFFLVCVYQLLISRPFNYPLLGACCLTFFFASLALTLAYRRACAPLREPFVIARKLRRFYLWVDKEQGWKHWDYDNLVPFTQVNKLVTTAGASTIYALRLAVIDPQTREIKQTLTPAPVQRTPEQCGQIWEFIRCYMDGKPEDLPPVRRQPNVHEPAADLVRFDRQFKGVITPDHRFEPGLFPRLYFAFWATFNYWPMRATAWIQRTAPRPALPPELKAAMAAEDKNPYRFFPLSADETLAVQGKLPRLLRRWAFVSVSSSALWGGAFVMVSIGILSTLWET